MGLRKFTLPRISPIKWLSNEYGYQRVWMSVCANVFNPDGDKVFEVAPSDPIQRGCIKIWWNPPHGERHVIDRALTVKAARRRIKEHKKCNSKF